MFLSLKSKNAAEGTFLTIFILYALCSQPTNRSQHKIPQNSKIYNAIQGFARNGASATGTTNVSPVEISGYSAKYSSKDLPEVILNEFLHILFLPF